MAGLDSVNPLARIACTLQGVPMSRESHDFLNVEPHQLAGLAQAYEDAAIQVAQIISELNLLGRLPEPWAGDYVSLAMTDHYNDVVVRDPFSTLAALQKYENELAAVGRNLRQMHADYIAVESAVMDQVERLRQI